MHKDWCGKQCYRCENPCELDKSIPCSPSCELLGPDGKPINKAQCEASGCDAYDWEEEDHD